MRLVTRSVPAHPCASCITKRTFIRVVRIFYSRRLSDIVLFGPPPSRAPSSRAQALPGCSGASNRVFLWPWSHRRAEDPPRLGGNMSGRLPRGPCLSRHRGLFLEAVPAPHYLEPCVAERHGHEIAYRHSLSRSEDIVVGLWLLKNKPHAFHVILCMSPVAPCIEVAKIEFLLKPVLDSCSRPRNLSRHEGFPSDRRFVVEKNAVAGMHA